jgi:hypothetical protein
MRKAPAGFNVTGVSSSQGLTNRKAELSFQFSAMHIPPGTSLVCTPRILSPVPILGPKIRKPQSTMFEKRLKQPLRLPTPSPSLHDLHYRDGSVENGTEKGQNRVTPPIGTTHIPNSCLMIIRTMYSHCPCLQSDTSAENISILVLPRIHHQHRVRLVKALLALDLTVENGVISQGTNSVYRAWQM